LIKEDQIANDRKNIMICSRLLWKLHPHFVRKMISIKYEGHPTSALYKGKVGFYLTRINQRRKMDPVNNTKYPTRVSDKGKIGLKQHRIVIRHKSWFNKKGGERNVVYNIKVSNPHPSPLTVENLLDTLNQIHPLTTLSDVHHDNTRSRHKQCAKRKREHDAKNGKHQKLHNKRKSEQETQAGTDKQTQGKNIKKTTITKANIAPTVRIRHINPRGMLTPGKVFSLQKLAASQHLDVLALTETHLTEHNLDLVNEVTGKWRLIIIPSPLRRHSQQGKRGIALMLKDHISATQRDNNINDETAQIYS